MAADEASHEIKIDYVTNTRYVVRLNGEAVGAITGVGLTDWTVLVGDVARPADSYREAARIARDLALALAARVAVLGFTVGDPVAYAGTMAQYHGPAYVEDINHVDGTLELVVVDDRGPVAVLHDVDPGHVTRRQGIRMVRDKG